jgi:hypothetical protein
MGFGSKSTQIKAEELAMDHCYKHQLLMHEKVLPEGTGSICKKGGIFEVFAQKKSSKFDGWEFGASKKGVTASKKVNCLEQVQVEQLLMVSEPNTFFYEEIPDLELEYYSCIRSDYNLALDFLHQDELLIYIPLVISYFFSYWITAKLRNSLTVFKSSLVLIITVALVNYYVHYFYYLGTLHICDFIY